MDEKKRKPQKEKVRGSATFDGQHFSFTPEQRGEAVQKNITTSGKSKLYETAGTKQSSIVAHLVADAKAADPAFEMIEALKQLYAKAGKEFPEVDVNDVDIVSQERLKIRLSKEQKEVKIYLSMPLVSTEKMYRDLQLNLAKLTSEMYLSEQVVKKLIE